MRRLGTTLTAVAALFLGGLALVPAGTVRAQTVTTTTTSSSSTSSTSSSSVTTSSSTSTSSTSSTLPCALSCDDGIAVAYEKLLRTVIGCHDAQAQYVFTAARRTRRCERRRPGRVQDRCLAKVAAQQANDLECEHVCESLAATGVAELSTALSAACCPSRVTEDDLLALASQLQGFDESAYCGLVQGGLQLPAFNADVTGPVSSSCRRRLIRATSKAHALRCGRQATARLQDIVRQRTTCAIGTAADSFNGTTTTKCDETDTTRQTAKHCPQCADEATPLRTVVNDGLAAIYGDCWDSARELVACTGDACNRARCNGTGCETVPVADGTACPDETPPNSCTIDVCRGGVCSHEGVCR